MYLQGLTFFGLTSEYRAALFKQIHEVVFHGKGGYDWHTVYNMPIWLRRYTYQEISEWYEEQNKRNEPQKSTAKKLARPDIKTDYTAKASRK